MTIEGQITSGDLPAAAAAGLPPEGEVRSGAAGAAFKQVFKYTSSSSEAVAFEVHLPLAPEFGGGAEAADPPLVAVSFYRGVKGGPLEEVKALVLKCTIETVKGLEGLGGEMVLKFTTHAVVGLKKGETLVIVVTG